MEALAAGVPLVTRDLPVLREVFGPAARYATDPAGFAAAPADALGTPDRRRASAGREPAASHSWDTAAARHVRAYERFVPTTVSSRTTGPGRRGG